MQGDYGQFIIDRGCFSPVNTVEIVNTGINRHRSTKKFRVSVTNSLLDDSWIEVVEQGNLPDSRNCGSRPDCSFESKFYNFDTKISRYFKVQILETYGSRGGGLKKFDISYGKV